LTVISLTARNKSAKTIATYGEAINQLTQLKRDLVAAMLSVDGRTTPNPLCWHVASAR